MRISPLLALSVLGCLPAARTWAAEYPQMGPDVFDVHASASADIAKAEAVAAAEHKAVLLDFGANWCIWCRRLHTILDTDPAVSKAVKNGFVVVMVDVNTRNGVDRNADVIKRYGNPVADGVPAVVVLDAGGKRLVTRSSESFGDGTDYVPAKISAFLAQWTPPGRP